LTHQDTKQARMEDDLCLPKDRRSHEPQRCCGKKSLPECQMLDFRHSKIDNLRVGSRGQQYFGRDALPRGLFFFRVADVPIISTLSRRVLGMRVQRTQRVISRGTVAAMARSWAIPPFGTEEYFGKLGSRTGQYLSS
jgi:hypothetical protein